MVIFSCSLFSYVGVKAHDASFIALQDIVARIPDESCRLASLDLNLSNDADCGPPSLPDLRAAHWELAVELLLPEAGAAPVDGAAMLRPLPLRRLDLSGHAWEETILKKLFTALRISGQAGLRHLAMRHSGGALDALWQHLLDCCQLKAGLESLDLSHSRPLAWRSGDCWMTLLTMPKLRALQLQHTGRGRSSAPASEFANVACLLNFCIRLLYISCGYMADDALSGTSGAHVSSIAVEVCNGAVGQANNALAKLNAPSPAA